LKELLMPDLDQIKQGEQAGIPVTVYLTLGFP